MPHFAEVVHAEWIDAPAATEKVEELLETAKKNDQVAKLLARVEPITDTVVETVQMVSLMGGRTVLAGMRANVAVTVTQLGLSMGNTLTALDVDRAIDMLNAEASKGLRV